MKTWHIHIEGQVQGVGFRPFVYVLAKEHAVPGWVNNSTDGVHIELNAEKEKALLFFDDLIKKAPKHAQITKHRLFQTEQKFFDTFQIIHSKASGVPDLLLTPDFALCADCRAELYAGGNRRQGYPFITCTNCGPRYSIVRQLPYDRVNTTMDSFPMCSNCASEYQDTADRRYYAQTNSCPVCPITLTLFDAERNNLGVEAEQIPDHIARLWRAGKIVAIKGIGGYLLTCDAGNEDAVQCLRARKHRPSKPLACMYPDTEAIQAGLVCAAEELSLLEGHIAPIVLLQKKDNDSQLAAGIAPHLGRIGAMLPYTPLFDLLLKKFAKPVVATSGNTSNSPIVFQDEKALNELSGVADFILVNNREIAVPQDDSVFAFTPFTRQRVIIRRSRGLAPTYIGPDFDWPAQSILAAGAMLKSSFSLLHRGNTYISPYLGDLEHFDTQENYRHTVVHYLNILECSPERILCDKHPEYASTRFAEAMAADSGVPVEYVQHHIAHFSAVLGENDLIHSEEPVLGIIWDGTGLGDDGQIWGGEFFRYERYEFLRCYYFDYFDFILGDKMPKEPRISAFSACWDVPGAEDVLREKFTNPEWQVYTKLLEKENNLQTSSVGRIFDAVASLLGLPDKQSFEGEAAMQLEALALGYFLKNGLDFSSSYFTEGAHYYRIPTKTLMTNLILDLKKGKTRDFIAAKFHYSLMKLVKIVAENLNIRTVAFSGGVFQNGLLVDLINHHLQGGFKLCFHRQLAPNDENIAFGQLICHCIDQYKNSINRTTTIEQ